MPEAEPTIKQPVSPTKEKLSTPTEQTPWKKAGQTFEEYNQKKIGELDRLIDALKGHLAWMTHR